jgi:tyrosyl-tRNA synthetase
MLKVSEQKIEEVLTRGVENIYPNKAALKKKLMSGEKIKIYCGFDPTASTLHIGNAIQLRKLSQFQKLGHEVIMLIGDFTGMIGDPTDKSSARKRLSREDVLKNSLNYKKIAGKFLDFSGKNPAKILYNSKWHDKLTFRDLIDVSSNFTVGQMIARDMFQQRIKEEKPIWLHEFLYPLMQAYDSVAMDIDLEIGGNDQVFNMLCGRELMKALKNKEKFVLSGKLLADPQGKKMGKSEGNMVSLEEKPDQMLGKIMSWPDSMIESGLEILTEISQEEIKEISSGMKSGNINPRDAKMKLAKEIVAYCHNKKAADVAEAEFEKIFKEKELPSEIEEVSLPKGDFHITDMAISLGLAKSKSEAKRLIIQGGLKIDGVVEKDWEKIIRIKTGQIFQAGKRKFKKVI